MSGDESSGTTVRARCGDSAKAINIVVSEVTGVVWENYPDDVAASPDHGPNIAIEAHPDLPDNGGKRVFPGKKCYDDTSAEAAMRRKVNVTATVSPGCTGQPVRFWVWDVDDPSAEDGGLPESGCTYPVDCDNSSHSNYNSQYDNRGDVTIWPSMIDVAATKYLEEGSSEVTATLWLSMRPGDNVRVTAVAGEQWECPTITWEMVDSGTGLPSRAKRTEMLTMWRHLWIERDSMNAVATTGAEKNFTSSTITDLGAGSFNPATGITTLDVDDLYDYWDGADRLNGGKLAVGGLEYTIVDMYDTGGDETLDVQGNPFGNGVLVNDDCNLYDDDYSGSGIFEIVLPLRESLLMMDKLMFQEAYIEPINLSTAYEDTVPFELNFGETSDISGLTPDVTGSSSFWTVMVMNAFQPKPGDDEDPDSEESTAGLSLVYLASDNPDKCAIYHETGREMGGNMSHHMAHEIGHTQNIGNPWVGHCSDSTCIMADGGSGVEFCDDCKNALRERSTW